MTIPGVDMVVAIALVAAIGDITRFGSPRQLVGYLGLHPSVRQSRPGPAQHGRITKQGRGHARGMLSRRRGRRCGHPAGRCIPALLQWKLRELELKAGSPSRRGGNKPGPARDYSLKTVRDKERQWLGMAEEEYRRFANAWKTRPPEKRTDAAKGERPC
jgi:transposase